MLPERFVASRMIENRAVSNTNLSVMGDTYVDPSKSPGVYAKPGFLWCRWCWWLPRDNPRRTVPTTDEFFQPSWFCFSDVHQPFPTLCWSLKIAPALEQGSCCLGCFSTKCGSWYQEDTCNHTQTAWVEAIFDEAIVGNENFFISRMQEVCISKGLPFLMDEELAIFRSFCRTVYRATANIEEIITKNYPDFDMILRAYLDPKLVIEARPEGGKYAYEI